MKAGCLAFSLLGELRITLDHVLLHGYPVPEVLFDNSIVYNLNILFRFDVLCFRSVSGFLF
jgi:hypothetical protein